MAACCAAAARPVHRRCAGYALPCAFPRAPQFAPLTPPPCLPPRCQLIKGVPALRGGGGYTEHVWVAKDELGEYIKEEPLLQLLQKML